MEDASHFSIRDQQTLQLAYRRDPHMLVVIEIGRCRLMFHIPQLPRLSSRCVHIACSCAHRYRSADRRRICLVLLPKVASITDHCMALHQSLRSQIRLFPKLCPSYLLSNHRRDSLPLQETSLAVISICQRDSYYLLIVEMYLTKWPRFIDPIRVPVILTWVIQMQIGTNLKPEFQ